MVKPAERTVEAGVQVLSRDDGPSLALVEGPGQAVAIVWPGIGASKRSLHRLQLGPGAVTRELSHPSEAVYYVVGGTARVHEASDIRHPLREGSMIHVAAGTPYHFETDAGATLLGGPCPPDLALYAEVSGVDAAADGGFDAGEHLDETDQPGVRIFHRDKPDVLVPMISRDARLIVWPGVGAQTANMNYVRLEPGEENVPHAHAGSEDTVHILQGSGTAVDLTHGRELEFAAGDTVHVPPGVRHALRADRGVEVRSVGGPCPADEMLLKAAGLATSGPDEAG